MIFFLRFHYTGKPKLAFIETIKAEGLIKYHQYNVSFWNSKSLKDKNLLKEKNNHQSFDIKLTHVLYKTLLNFESSIKVSKGMINNKKAMILNFSSESLLSTFSGDMIMNKNN